MNAKAARALRKMIGFHPTQVFRYVAGRNKKGQLTHITVDPRSTRGVYRAAKQAIRTGGGK